MEPPVAGLRRLLLLLLLLHYSVLFVHDIVSRWLSFISLELFTSTLDKEFITVIISLY